MNNLKIARVGLFVILMIFVCSLNTEASDNPPGNWKTIIKGQEFTSMIKLTSSAENDTLIIDCKIHDTGSDDGIYLRDVNNVYIKNCEIYNVGGSGIRLGSGGSTSNVTIEGNTIYNTIENGISVAQRYESGIDHKNLRILNNIIHDTATPGDDKHHGIYVQSQDSLIEGNTVYNCNGGNGISIRSSGIVRKNKLWNIDGTPIKYYGDHMKGPSDLLLIENNIAYDSGESVIRIGDIVSSSLAVSNFVVRFNTAISFDSSVYTFENNLPQYNVSVYGNILINTKSSSRIVTGALDYDSRNYKSTSLEGFSNSTSPYDFHLKEGHPATGFATGESDFPEEDIDGDSRSSDHLNAGADQSTNTQSPIAPPKNLRLSS